MNNKLSLNIDLRWLAGALLAVIVGMLLMWRPWSQATTEDRTIQVTGEVTLRAEPDEFVFYPSYEFKNKNGDVALAAASKKSEEIVSRLKELGVAENKIKTHVSGYDGGYYREPTSDEVVYSLNVQITISSLKDAQKIQDYLASTSPIGAVTPQASFSEQKRKELENEARDKATQDARSKAEQTAKNLGTRLSKLKSVSEGSGFGLFHGRAIAEDTASDKLTPSPRVQPGENELHFSVTVVYFIR